MYILAFLSRENFEIRDFIHIYIATLPAIISINPRGRLLNRLTYDPRKGVGWGSAVPFHPGVHRHVGCLPHEPSSAPRNFL